MNSLLGTNRMMKSATLYKRLPNLKIAIPLDQLKYTPPTQNIGILELPVIW